MGEGRLRGERRGVGWKVGVVASSLNPESERFL